MKKGIGILQILLSCVLFCGCSFSFGSSDSDLSSASGSSSSNPSSSSSGDTTPDSSDGSTNSSSSSLDGSSSGSSDSTPDSSDSTPDSSDSTPDSSDSPDDSTQGDSSAPDHEHTDGDGNELCDSCGESVVVTVDFFAVNDLHGKLKSNDSQPGVGGLTTYLKDAKTKNPNTVLLSSGDMWQGSSESNLTRGMIVNDWMSEMDFVSMTLGNHEFDWGTSYIAENAAASSFAYLAINVYERSTNERADYCQPSVMVERGGAKIGVIGAIGDCYSSISSDKVADVYFKTGSQLTSLVKAESEKLKAAGADCIVYSVHDGFDNYDEALSGGYVDVVFEGHTHSRYVRQDDAGVYHLQGGGENRNISHATLNVNVVENSVVTTTAETVSNSIYGAKASDPLLETLLNKYKDDIEIGDQVLGYNAKYRDDSELEALAAELYLKAGLERWGEEYDIFLGGGFFQARSPYSLQRGNVTYSAIQTIFPFDNPLVLCKVSGAKLKSQFLAGKDNYYVSCSEYGESIKNSINNSATYYIVIDTYSALYAPNGATEIARYDETTFARDLIAEYIKAGGLAT